VTLGTDPLLSDTDGDGASDYDEIAFDGNAASYTPGLDSDPLDPDTDGDRLNDGVEIAHGSNPLNPASYPSLADGDLAPLGSPDGSVNAADYLISLRLTLGLLTPTVLELAHGDLYPPGNPDGLINLSDTLLQQQLLFASP
jgi:Bacterial TSP3 repeat